MFFIKILRKIAHVNKILAIPQIPLSPSDCLASLSIVKLLLRFIIHEPSDDNYLPLKMQSFG